MTAQPPTHPLAPRFEQWRADRAAQRSSSPDPRRRAVITIVSDEPVFLPLWLRYYSRFFAREDIYVIDTEPGEPTTAQASPGRFERIRAVNDGLDNLFMVRQVEALQRRLLERYDVVVVCDVDEILVPSPSLGTLGDYLDRFAEPWVNCLAYEVLHFRDREPALAPEQPILAQRGYWYVNNGYMKPLVTTVPVRWRPGFHGREDFHMRIDPDLRLIHLHRVDYELCRERHRARAARPVAPLDADEGWGAQNFIVEEPAFGEWFYSDSCFPGIEIHPEEIPAAWRGAF